MAIGMTTNGRCLSMLLPVLMLAAAPASAQGSLAERGQQVYAASKCGACHAIAGKGNAKGALDGVGTKLSADEIREWIVNAPAMSAKVKAERKPAMRAYTALSKDEVDALVAYMQSLKK
jgi:mono/diheme cytochrome c family protein